MSPISFISARIAKVMPRFPAKLCLFGLGILLSDLRVFGFIATLSLLRLPNSVDENKDKELRLTASLLLDMNDITTLQLHLCVYAFTDRISCLLIRTTEDLHHHALEVLFQQLPRANRMFRSSIMPAVGERGRSLFELHPSWSIFVLIFLQAS